MAVGGLQAVRDALIFAYAENLIDDEEFALLYDHNRFPYTDMAHRFGRSPSELCLIFNLVLDTVHETHHHRLESWDQPFLTPDQLYTYAQAVHQRAWCPFTKLLWVCGWDGKTDSPTKIPPANHVQWP
jgi:hypothetical protein